MLVRALVYKGTLCLAACRRLLVGVLIRMVYFFADLELQQLAVERFRSILGEADCPAVASCLSGFACFPRQPLPVEQVLGGTAQVAPR